MYPSCGCRGKVLFKEMPFPTLFLEGWPMTKITIHYFLLFLPPDSWTPGAIWQLKLKCHSYFFSFTILLLSSLPSFIFPIPFSPIYKRWQGYQSMSSCFLPDPFVSLLARIISPVSQSTFPPRFDCFWEGKKNQLDSLSPQSCASAPASPPVPSPHIWKTHLHFGLVIWLQQ